MTPSKINKRIAVNGLTHTQVQAVSTLLLTQANDIQIKLIIVTAIQEARRRGITIHTLT